MKKVLSPTTLVLAFIGISVIGYLFYQYYTQQEALKKLFNTVNSVKSYTQEVQTRAVLSDRILEIEGVYSNDANTDVFAANVITNVIIPETDTPLTFSLENIAIKDSVYVKVETESDILAATIPTGPDWHLFAADSIPEEFLGIAIPGPILDNLAILSEGGAYVSLISYENSSMSSTEKLAHYRFRLSGEVPKNPGPLTALIERIGKNGFVDVWIDKESLHVNQMVFSNPPYFSTTTIRSINTPPVVSPPIE